MKIKLIEDHDQKVPYLERIFLNRGLKKQDIKEFLNTNDNHIINYNKLDNLEKAARVLVNHYNKKNKIMIQVDCDVDGYTSAAIMYNYLYHNLPGIDLYYQVHTDKTHGLTLTPEVLEKKYDLIIIPDAGSNQFEELEMLNKKGIDIIILDHHEADYESPHAIVVNNQLSKNYTNKSLCGAGVVYQFCRFLDDNIIENGFSKAEDFLDLVALGLVADMSDLRNLETKRLIEKGLDQINSSSSKSNFFFKMLVEKNSYSLGPKVTPIGISFYIAPMINSVVRVGTEEERILAFEAFLADKGSLEVASTKRGAKGETETLAEQAARTLSNVRNRQKTTRDKAMKELEKQITPESLEKNTVILLDTKGLLDKNLNGLVANQIMAKYRRPVFVMSQKDNFFAGSARNFENEMLPDFKDFIEKSGLAEFSAGHKNAFGCSFSAENLEKFLVYANEKLNYENFEPEVYIDFEIDSKDLTEGLIASIADLNMIWGQGLPEPFFLVKGVKVDDRNIFLLGKTTNPTLKIEINNIEGIKFKSSEDEAINLVPNNYTSSSINIIGKAKWNYYQGNKKPQIIITDYEKIGNLIDF